MVIQLRPQGPHSNNVRQYTYIYIYSENIDLDGYSEGHQDSVGGSAEIFGQKNIQQPNPTSRSPFSSPSSPSLSVPCKMGQKRLTRAQAQQELDVVLDKIRRLHSYAGNVQAQVEAELGSMSIPPQQVRDRLENDERMNKHYKQVTEILKAQVAEEAEKCKALADEYKSVKRAVFIRRDELEILKLKKTDPELNDIQWQVLSNIKTDLLEYPTLLGEVTGDETFMQAIKKSYESKLEGLETTLKKLTHNVFKLPNICSNKVLTSLASFAETTLEPAISIVKHQHEELETGLGEANERSKVLETELGEANERSIRLEKRIEQLEAEKENTSVDITNLTSEHSIREQRLTNDIAALEKKLEAQLENARTTAAAKVKVFKGEIESYRGTVKELEKGKEALEETVEMWQKHVKVRRQEYDELNAKYKANQEQLKTAKGQVLSLEEDLRTEKGAAVATKETAEQDKQSLHNKVIELEAAGREVLKANKSLTAELSTLKASSEKDIRSLQSQLSTEKAEKESLQQSHEFDIQAVRSQLSTAMTKIDSFKQSIAHQAQKLQDELASLVHHSVSGYEESRAKRGLGPDSPEKPVSKRRRRQDSVPQSGAQGLLGSSIEASSSMDPATATGQTIVNPESSSPGTLIQSSQSTDSATCPPGLSRASDEVKDVWRQIEFPIDWDMGASQTLLHGFIKANKKTPMSRPAGLLDCSSAQPNCFLRRVSKMKSALDNGDDKSCSNCKVKMWPCVRVSFVADDLANVGDNEDGEEKRWKLTIREG